MNMLALTWGETTIVVDAGVMFPDPELLGVDRIIPDLTYLQQKGGVAALVLTHGHEDHIGGVPHVAAARATARSTARRSRWRWSSRSCASTASTTRRRSCRCGRATASPSARSRSSSSASRTACPTAWRWRSTRPSASIVHTGDFKIDQTPIDGEHFDVHRFAAARRRGRAGAVRRQHQHRSPRLHRLGDRGHRGVRGDLHQRRPAG